MRIILCVLSLLMVAIPVHSAARIGVLPVMPAFGAETEFASEEMRASIQAAIVSDLQNLKLGEVVALQWQIPLEEDQRPNFETLVGLGVENGCTGVLLVQIRDLRYEVKEIELPLVGSVEAGEAEVVLSGGLIDVASSAGVAPMNAKAKEKQQPRKGPGFSELVNRSLDDKELRNTALGKAFDSVRKQIADEMKTGIPRLSKDAVELPARSNAPEGIGFAQDAFEFKTFTGYDRRGVVAVVNRGDSPRAFKLLPVSSLKGVTTGFVGDGSIDKACTLAPGQWKYVRFILNTPDVPLNGAELKLGLFTAEGDEEPDTKGKPYDTAIMRLNTKYPNTQLSLEIVAQDPHTLEYKCRLKNAGAPVWGLGVDVEDDKQKDLVRFIPGMSERVFIPANGVIDFTVAPNLNPNMPAIDVPIKVSGLSDANSPGATLHFEIPKGKQVYYGLANTSSSSGSFAGWCINEGGTYQSDGDGRESCTGLGHSWSDASFSQNAAYALGKMWAALSGWLGGLPDNYDDQRAVTGYRGLTVRPELLKRLLELEKQDTLYPSAYISDKWAGIVTFMPSPEGIPTVIFGAYPLDKREQVVNISQLNEKGHDAKWPFVRFDEEGKALVVWVDTAGGKTNVALRKSKDPAHTEWEKIVNITSHGKGVDDPVILTGKNGYVAVVWEDLRQGKSAVYARVSKDGGNTFLPEVALKGENNESQRWPQLTALKNGIGLVYVSKAGGKESVRFVTLDTEFKTSGKPVQLSNEGVSCGEPQIVSLSNGSLGAVWREGDGAASEIWFSSFENNVPTPAKRLSTDNAYSEYPVIYRNKDEFVVTYHSDASGVTDLVYQIKSKDGGKTWTSPSALPSLQGVIEKGWLQVTFNLENSREEYLPFDTHFLVNGKEVALLKNTVLEGVYLFPVPKELLRGTMGRLHGNTVEMKIDNPMDGHYIYSSEHRLIAKWAYSQMPLVASSQEEADKIAKTIGNDRNHSDPDLVLAANPMPKLPAELKAGQKMPLAFDVYNIGEAPASEVVIDLYGGEKLDLLEKPKPLVSKELGIIQPGESVRVDSEFVFDPGRTPRVHAVLRMKEKDFHPADNVWALSFTLGEAGTLPPTLGTDTPNIFYTPGLLDAVNIPNMGKLTNLINLPSLTDMLNVSDILSLPKLEIPNIKDFGNALQEKLGGLNLPNPF